MINITRMSALPFHLLRPLCLSLTLGATAVSLAAVPGYAADDDEYARCVADLSGTGIDILQASASCAGTRFPGALGECVVDVNGNTGIDTADVLVGCERSRRPDEVAGCTIDIHQALLEQPSASALEHCSRSLLPERYGVCVIDMSQEAQLAVDAALERCIRAGYRPWTTAPRL